MTNLPTPPASTLAHNPWKTHYSPWIPAIVTGATNASLGKRETKHENRDEKEFDEGRFETLGHFRGRDQHVRGSLVRHSNDLPTRGRTDPVRGDGGTTGGQSASKGVRALTLGAVPTPDTS